MIHLAIDTATEILSVAAKTLQSTQHEAVPRIVSHVRDAGLKHTGSLMPAVSMVLDEIDAKPADITLVSCTRGPGSFTGLRIGMATAKGLAWSIAAAHGMDTPPIVSVPTLEVMASALPATPSVAVLPVIDGRKGRYYGAAFRHGARATPDLDLEASSLLLTALDALGENLEERARSLVITGPHAESFLSASESALARLPAGDWTIVLDPGFRDGWARPLLPLAEHAYAARGADSLDDGPDYLRLSEAEESLLERHRGGK